MDDFSPLSEQRVASFPATITIARETSRMDFTSVNGQSSCGAPLASPLPLPPPSILQKQQVHSTSQSSLSHHHEQHTAATETDLSSMGSLPMHAADAHEGHTSTTTSSNSMNNDIMEDSNMEDSVPDHHDDIDTDADMMETEDTLMILQENEPPKAPEHHAPVIPAVATAATPSVSPRRRSILKSSSQYQPKAGHHPNAPVLRKEVIFVTIQVRGYQQTLGDNPCVSYGPPVSLDWFYQDYGHFDLNAFEANRGPRRKVRQMCLNYYQRVQMLQALGYNDPQIKEAEKAVQKCKIQRNLTRTLLPAKRIEEAMASVQRKAKRRWTPR